MAYTLHASAPAGSATSRALPPPAALAHGAAAGRAMRRRPSAASGACSAIGSRASGLSGAMGGVAVAARRRPRARLAVCAVSAGQQEALWESQVREGRVKSVDARGAAALMQQGWVLLDVRPPHEVAKVSIVGAVEVPLFLPEVRSDPASLLKRFSTWTTGGWWLGGTHMVPNTRFLDQVREKVPLDANVVVGCQRGLRSLAACEQLSRAGYGRLAWVNGGFDTAVEGDLPTQPDNTDIRFAGIGGLSKALGWTEVQQQYSRGFLGGAETIIKVVAIFLAVDLLIFAYEYWSVLQAGGIPEAP